jgi:hypothetical protein
MHAGAGDGCWSAWTGRRRRRPAPRRGPRGEEPPRPTTGALALAVVLVPLLAQWLDSRGGRPGADGTAFACIRDGVQAFDEERYTEAAAAFDRYLRSAAGRRRRLVQPRHAYHRAGHAGLRHLGLAPRAAPRSPEPGRPAQPAGGGRAARAGGAGHAAPLLRSSEILLLAALAWLGGVAGACGSHGAGRARNAAIAAFTFTLILAAAGWASTRDPEVLIVLEPVTLRTGPALRADPVAELEAGTGCVPSRRGGTGSGRAPPAGRGLDRNAT